MANVVIKEDHNSFESLQYKQIEVNENANKNVPNKVYKVVDRNAREALSNVQISLDDNYEVLGVMQESNSPKIGDSFQTAICKLHNAILDLELTCAAALNELNERLTALEVKIS